MHAAMPQQLPDQPIGEAYERLLRSRRRLLGFGIVLLVLSVVNLAWPVLLWAALVLLFILGFASGLAVGSIEAVLLGSGTGLAVGLTYALSLPLIAGLALIVALRSMSTAKRLRPYGMDARGARIVGWTAFGFAAFNVLTLAVGALSFFTG